MFHSGRALYYPFIHFKDERWLKLSALYWDVMGRIVPEGYTREDGEVVRALGSYVENLRPGWVRPHFGQRFTEFVASKATELRSGYAIVNRHGWSTVSAGQHPPTPGDASGRDPRLSYVFYEKMSPDVQRVMQESGLVLADQADKRWIGMHPRLAQVYMTALADQLAGERGFCPLTDETVDHVAVGGNSVERLGQLLLGENANLAGGSAGPLEVENLTAFLAIETALPTKIEELSVEKILEFRERYAAERATFQKTLLNFVKPREWLNKIVDPALLAEQVQSEFEREIKPKLDELREMQRSVGIDTVRGVLTMQFGVPAVLTQGAALTGMTADPVLALGAGTALALSSVLRDRRKATREVASSNVSYLLRVEEHLTPRGVLGWVRDAMRKLRPK